MENNPILDLFKRVEKKELSPEKAYVELMIEFVAVNRHFLGNMKPESITIPTYGIDLSVDTKITRIAPARNNGKDRKVFITKGKTYVVNNIKPNYLGHKWAISFKTDNGYSRWYSYESIKKYYMW